MFMESIPRITLVSSGIPDLLPMQDRSSGLHHSEVLSDYCIRQGHYEKSDMEMNRVQLGCALEDTIAARYAQQYPNRYIQPGELWLGGDLPITPDLYDTLTGEPEEIKLSWISSRHPPDSQKFDRFWWQVMSQCCALGVTSGKLNITHIRGDYKGFEIHHNVWRREFDKTELNQHERTILRHRDRMLREGYGLHE